MGVERVRVHAPVMPEEGHGPLLRFGLALDPCRTRTCPAASAQANTVSTFASPSKKAAFRAFVAVGSHANASGSSTLLERETEVGRFENSAARIME